MAKAQELKDLDVDRVDGVDKPATGRNFLLFKSEDGDAIMKGYGAVATAAHIVLEKVRKDSKAVVSRKSAIALNGLAQVLGEGAVFVGKSVPTQPYMLTEPDVNARGPADEKLGPNFTAKAGPGSMVGSVQFSVEDADGVAKAWPPADDEKEKEPEEDDMMNGKQKPNPFAKKGLENFGDKKAAPFKSEDGSEGIVRSMEAMAKAMEALPGQIVKALVAGPVQKDAGDEPAEPVRPRSRQIEEDEPVRVRKSGGYEPRMGVSFADIAFGKR
jgi:hypothetical protein